MKSRFSLFFIALLTLALLNCQNPSADSPNEDNPESDSKQIIAFSFAGPSVAGLISEVDHTITVTVPSGTDRSNLVPAITHTGASISPGTGTARNFTDPVTYTVTAADGSTQAYTVTVSIFPTQAWYSHSSGKYGFAKTRHSLRVDTGTFEEADEYWSGTAWVAYFGLKGTLAHVSNDTYDATLTSMYRTSPTVEGTLEWYAAGTSAFTEYIGYVWSTSGSATTRVTLTPTGSTMVYRRDQNGDSAVVGSADYSDTMGMASQSDIPGSGTYPYDVYIGLNFQGSDTVFSSP